MTYLLIRDGQSRVLGNSLDLRLGLGIVHDRVDGRSLVDHRRFLVNRVDVLGIGLVELDRISDRRRREGRATRWRTGVESE